MQFFHITIIKLYITLHLPRPICRIYSGFSDNVIAEIDKAPLPTSGEPALTGLKVPSRFSLCTSFNAACRLRAKYEKEYIFTFIIFI